MKNEIFPPDGAEECNVHHQIAIVEKREANAFGVLTFYSCNHDQHLHLTGKTDSRENRNHTAFPRKQFYVSHKEASGAYKKAIELTLERGFKILHFTSQRNYG